MKIDPTDPYLFHDMRMCLILGKTPEKPVYDEGIFDLPSVESTADGLTKLLFGEPTKSRGVQIGFGKTIFKMLSYIDFCFDIGANPLPHLRQAFPEWTWKYHKEHEGAIYCPGVDYVFSTCLHYVTASRPDGGFRFLCTLDDPTEEDYPEDMAFLRAGYRLIRADD